MTLPASSFATTSCCFAWYGANPAALRYIRAESKLVHIYELADNDHQHLFCVRCHRLDEVVDEKLIELERIALKARDLAPAPRAREAINGICAACAADTIQTQEVPHAASRSGTEICATHRGALSPSRTPPGATCVRLPPSPPAPPSPHRCPCRPSGSRRSRRRPCGIRRLRSHAPGRPR